MKRNNKWLLFGLAGVLIIAAGLYINRGETVSYVDPVDGDVVKTVTLEAVLESSSAHTIFSKTDGMVLTVFKKNGDSVTANEPVIEIEVNKRQELNQLTKAQQTMVLSFLEKPEHDEWTAKLSPYMSLYLKAEEQYNEAIANYDNMMLLLNAGAVDSRDVKEAALTLSEAGDKLNTAEDKWWTASILVYEEMNKTEKKQWDRIEESYLSNKLEQNRVIIEAPMTGTLSSVYVEPGHLIRKNGVLFMTIDPSKLKIQSEVAPETAAQLKEGHPINIRFKSSGTETTGKVSKISSKVVEKVSSDGTVLKRVLVEAAFDEPQFDAKLGDALTLTIQTQKLESTLSLPLSAVIEKNGTYWIWYNDQGVLAEKQIEPILVGDDALALPKTFDRNWRVVAPSKELNIGDRIH